MKCNRKNFSFLIAALLVLALTLPVHAAPTVRTWTSWDGLWSWFAGWWKAGIASDSDGKAPEGPGEPSGPAGINLDPNGQADKAGIESDPNGKPQEIGDAGNAVTSGEPWS
jgi:hypothetical protein